VHSYCREYLKDVMKEVRAKLPGWQIRQAYAFKNSCGYEFHGPFGFYRFFGSKCDCLWSARAEGWIAYLDYTYKKEG